MLNKLDPKLIVILGVLAYFRGPRGREEPLDGRCGSATELLGGRVVWTVDGRGSTVTTFVVFPRICLLYTSPSPRD